MYFSVQSIRPIEQVIRAPEVSAADFVGRASAQATTKKVAPKPARAAKNIKGRTFGKR